MEPVVYLHVGHWLIRVFYIVDRDLLAGNQRMLMFHRCTYIILILDNPFTNGSARHHLADLLYVPK